MRDSEPFGTNLGRGSEHKRGTLYRATKQGKRSKSLQAIVGILSYASCPCRLSAYAQWMAPSEHFQDEIVVRLGGALK